MSEVMLLTTAEVPGRRVVEVLGVVDGAYTFNPAWKVGVEGALAVMQTFEYEPYEVEMARGRALARKELIERARGIGADAVIGLRFEISPIGEKLVEVLVYGTAVRTAAS